MIWPKQLVLECGRSRAEAVPAAIRRMLSELDACCVLGNPGALIRLPWPVRDWPPTMTCIEYELLRESALRIVAFWPRVPRIVCFDKHGKSVDLVYPADAYVYGELWNLIGVLELENMGEFFRKLVSLCESGRAVALGQAIQWNES